VLQSDCDEDGAALLLRPPANKLTPSNDKRIICRTSLPEPAGGIGEPLDSPG
jgi:hypothetical protein